MARKIAFVIDDDPVTLRLVAEVLQRLKYSVHAFSSAADALAVANQFLPDAVLCDLCLPNIDGIKVLSFFQDKDESIGRILMTGYRLDEKVVVGQRSKAVMVVLEKPFAIRGVSKALYLVESGRSGKIIKAAT